MQSGAVQLRTCRTLRIHLAAALQTAGPVVPSERPARFYYPLAMGLVHVLFEHLTLADFLVRLLIW